MLHLTINTGDVRQTSRDAVSPLLLKSCKKLLTTGRHDVPRRRAYQVHVTCGIDRTLLVHALHRKGLRPLVTFGVAPDDEAADNVWPELQKSYLRATDGLKDLRSADFAAPHRPTRTPWCAEFIYWKEVAEAAPLREFEVALAWAWIDHLQNGPS